MSLLTFLCAGFFALFALSNLRMLHMFQLNSYSYREHISWSLRGIFRRTPFAFLKIRAIISADSVTKKPLVFTPRIKRLTFTSWMLGIAFIAAAFFLVTDFFKPWILLVTLVIYLLFLTTPTVLLANLINTPVEALIRRHYIKDAKRIVSKHPGLIVVGITGSYGKTSTKHYVAKLLSSKYNVLMTPQSFNTPMGICMTIRSELRPYHQVFVVEMGAKKRGEIKELCDIINPDIAVLTSIGPAHLQTFGSLDNTIKTKFEIIEAVSNSTQSLRVAIINGDQVELTDNFKQYVPNDVSTITYGLKSEADILASEITASKNGSTFNINGSKFSTSLVGVHNVQNLCAAVAVARHLGVSEHEIAAKMLKIQPAEHRLELKKQDAKTYILDDAYNSNPAGAKAALDVLELMDGLKVVITPGMVELGDAHVQANFNFGRQIAHVADFVILVGEQQTRPIQDGIQSTDYSERKVHITNNVVDGIHKAQSITTDKTKYILLENDLPDNYKE